MPAITVPKWGQLALIPFQPSVPLQETLSHLTDIMQATDGSESRVPMRTAPRVVYTYSFPAKIFDTPELYNLLYAALRKKFAVPVWQQASRLGVNATVGDTEIKLVLDRAVSDFDYFADGGLALLYVSKDLWQWVEVTGTDAGENSITIATPLARSWSKNNAFIMPMRVGYVVDKASKSVSGISSKYEMAFDIIDNPDIAGVVPAQYDGEDLYLDSGLMPNGGSLVREISAEIDEFDAQLGPVFKRTLWKNSRYAYNTRFVIESPAELVALKERFQRHQGRFRKFWLPTFDMNLRVKAVSGSTIDIYPGDYGQYGQMHKTIAFQLLDGNTEIRKVTAVAAVDSETTRLTLSAPVSFTKENIFYTSYLGLCRLDSDTLEIGWIGNGKCEAGLRIIEIDPS